MIIFTCSALVKLILPTMKFKYDLLSEWVYLFLLTFVLSSHVSCKIRVTPGLIFHNTVFLAVSF